jgi:LysR family glycine cleavage system transcriptional activator
MTGRLWGGRYASRILCNPTAAMRIPPLHAIRALDALSRLGSISSAADELNVTRSAVSHQLAQLEEFLGFEVTAKVGRNVQLTPAATRYLREARTALQMLVGASSHPDSPRLSGALKISCVPGFATACLCPHIDSFQQLHPDVRIEISTPPGLDDVGAPDIDIFVAFGKGDWPGFYAPLLAEIEMTPVCSPSLLNMRGGMSLPRDLSRFPLVHLGSTHNWSRWLSAARTDIDSYRGIVCTDLHLVLSAVLAGQGVALADTLTCGAALEAGTLVRPFALAIRSTMAYYTLTRPDKTGAPVVEAFRTWLQDIVLTMA